MPVFPNLRTAYHYDDKVAQYYLLQAMGIPVPRTWVFWRREEAIEFCRRTTYPIVLKLSGGAGSRNVRLLRDRNEALYWVENLFFSGVFNLDQPAHSPYALLARLKPSLRLLVRGWHPAPGAWFDLHKNYVLFQEFLPDNNYDTRITVIGRRAFGFRRLNREGDFRASGSGRIDWAPASVDVRFVWLAARVARALGSQSVAIDGLYSGGQPVVGEISYTYASEAVRACPGHWQTPEGPTQQDLVWSAGQTHPQDAILDDFVASVRQSCALCATTERATPPLDAGV
jgi:hypothetical protein